METKQKSLKLNFAMNVILTMSSFIFPIITFPYISRVLLPIGTGRVSFATSLISYFLMLSQLGIPTYAIRACAKVRDDKTELTRTAQELLIINLMMTVVSYVLLIVCLIFVPRLKADRILYVIISLTLVLSAIGMEWIYKALEQYTYITIRSVIFKLVALVAMFMLVKEKSDYVIYGAITIFASSASNILNFINVHKYIDLKPVGNYDLKRHLKPVGIFFAMSCATTIYTHLDTVMLGFMKSDEDVGYYNAAVKIKTVLVGIVTSLGAVLLPRVSYYIEHGMMDEFNKITKKAFNFVLFISVPLVIYTIMFAKEGVLFISGKAFGGSVVPMQIIMPTLLLIGITNILGMQILVPLGKEKIVLYSEIAGAITDLILNAVFIPKLASSGAAIGTLAAEFVVLIVQSYYLRDEIRELIPKIKASLYKIAAAALTGAALSFAFMYASLKPFIILALSLVVFFGAYLVMTAVLKESFMLELLTDIKNKTVFKNKA